MQSRGIHWIRKHCLSKHSLVQKNLHYRIPCYCMVQPYPTIGLFLNSLSTSKVNIWRKLFWELCVQVSCFLVFIQNLTNFHEYFCVPIVISSRFSVFYPINMEFWDHKRCVMIFFFSFANKGWVVNTKNCL